MGLKVLTLALDAFTGKKVKLHATGETATVEVKHEDNKMTFFLCFGDGRREEVRWSADLQGFCVAESEIDECEEPAAA